MRSMYPQLPTSCVMCTPSPVIIIIIINTSLSSTPPSSSPSSSSFSPSPAPSYDVPADRGSLPPLSATCFHPPHYPSPVSFSDLPPSSQTFFMFIIPSPHFILLLLLLPISSIHSLFTSCLRSNSILFHQSSSQINPLSCLTGSTFKDKKTKAEIGASALDKLDRQPILIAMPFGKWVNKLCRASNTRTEQRDSPAQATSKYSLLDLATSPRLFWNSVKSKPSQDKADRSLSTPYHGQTANPYGLVFKESVTTPPLSCCSKEIAEDPCKFLPLLGFAPH